MPVLNADDLTLLRQDHKARIFGSFLKPLTLWTAQVNSGALSRADTVIPFDGGSGLDWTEVKTYQEVWIGTAAGTHDKGKLRIKSNASGDGGVTGTVTFQPNNVIWADDMYLTFIHNYPFSVMYPFIDGGEIFYKDTTITYSDQNEEPPPIVVADVWPRAQRLNAGNAVVYIDASGSYVTTSGAAISTYACSVYPTSGATLTFNTGTGIGYLEVTSSSPDYRWLQFTVTDDNGKSQSSWRCVFIHGENPDDTNYPHTDFTTGQVTGNWENGGWSMSLAAHDDVTLADIPDDTFACIWKEREFDHKEKNIALVDNVLFYNPQVTFTVTPGAPCNIAAEFHAGVMIDGVPDNGTNISITLQAPVAISDVQNANTSTGTLDISGFTLTGANCSGTIDAIYSGTTIFSVDYRPGEIFSAASEYASPLVCFPKELIVGYVRGEKLTFSDDQGTGDDTIDITTIEGLLKNEYMFSISLASRPTGTASKWYEYESWLTIGRACHHIWRWHSTLFQVADVIGLLDNTDGRAYAEFENGTLYSMPDTMARQHGIRAHVTCNKRGQIHLTQDVQLLLDGDRAGLATVATATEDDYHNLSLGRKPEDRTALVYGSGLAFGGSYSADASGVQQPDVSPYCALAPGSKPSGMGEGVINFERQVLTSQNQLNQIVGRVYGQANNLYPELRLDFSGDYLDVFDVHLAEFWEIDIATSDTIKGLAIPDLKLIVRDITATLNVDSGDIETHVTFEPETAAEIGVTTECPGPPTDLGGAIPAIPTTDGLPGAIVTASSVEYLPPDSSSWTQRTSEATEDLIQDPFWRITQASTASEDAILWRCGVGFVKRSDDAGQTWSTVTPGSNPPNDASDAPAPTVGNVTFIMIEGNYLYNQEFVVLANWQNATSDWRSWLAYTDDDGSTWTWKYLAATDTSCLNPGVEYDIPVGSPFAGMATDTGMESLVQVDSDIYIFAYQADTSDGNDSIYAQGIKDNGDGTLTVGTAKFVGTATSFGGAVCKADTNKFIIIAYSARDTKTSVCTINSTTLVVTSSAFASIETATEIAKDVSLYRGNPRIVCPDASTVIYAGTRIYPLEPNGSGCILPAFPGGDHFLVGSLSGTTITWNTTTCMGDTVSDWQELTDTYLSDLGRTFHMLDCGSSSHYLISYIDGNDQKAYVVAGTGATLGTPLDMAITSDSDDLDECSLIPLSTTKFAYIWIEDAADRKKIRGTILTRSGTTLTKGSNQDIYSVAGFSPHTLETHAISSSAFGLTAHNIGSSICTGIIRCTVATNTITVADTCTNFVSNSGSAQSYWTIGVSATKFLNTRLVPYIYSLPVQADPKAILHDVAFSCTTVGDAKGTGISIGKGAGAKVWTIVGDDSTLELLEVALPALTVSNRFSLGSATWAQMAANTYIARPFAVFADDDEVYIAGRMNDPQSLGNPSHIIGTATGGASFILVEGAWTTDWCGCLYVTPGGVVVAIRNDGSSSKLYIGDATGVDLKSTTILAAGVNWHAIGLDFIDASIIVGNDTGSTFMVAITVPPYLDWWDLTSDHPTGNGINSIELL